MTLRGRLKRLESHWVVGFASLLVSILFAAALGLLCYAIFYLLASLFGWSRAIVESLLLVSGILWLPLAVGLAAPQVAKLTQATRETEPGPLAPFV